MVNINIYLPGKIDFHIDLPTSWNDLDAPELHRVAETFLQEQDIAETKAEILKFIIEYRAKKAKQKLPADWFFYLNPDDFVIQCFPIIAPIFEKVNRTTTPQPLYFRLRKYLPTTFDTMTCAEFEDCETQATLFQAAPGPEPLAKLAAILFRPAGVTYMRYNHRTATYHTYQVDKKSPFFQKLPPAELYAIFLWYTSCRDLLPIIFKHLYNSGSNKKSKPDPMIFTKTIHAGAGEKNGSREKIRASNLYEFLFECDLEAKKNKELNEYYESQK